MERIGALETLKGLPVGYMIPTQRAELALFQESVEEFVKHARKEGRKVRAGGDAAEGEMDQEDER